MRKVMLYKVSSNIAKWATFLLFATFSNINQAQNLSGNTAPVLTDTASQITATYPEQIDSFSSSNSPQNSALPWVYSAPDTNAARAQQRVNIPMISSILSRTKKWLKVSTQHKVPVWIERKYAKLIGNLAFIGDTSAPAFLSKSRSADGVDNHLGSVTADTVVQVAAAESNWLHITPLQPFDVWVKTTEYDHALQNLASVGKDTNEQIKSSSAAVVGNHSASDQRKEQLRDQSITLYGTAKLIKTSTKQVTGKALPLNNVLDSPAAETASTLINEKPPTTLQEIKPFDEYVSSLCSQQSETKLLQLSSFRDIAALEDYVSRQKQLSANKLQRARSLNGKWYYLIYGAYRDSAAAANARTAIGIENAIIRSAGLLQKSRCPA